jgi:3-methyl-2-oxobutanoate hydroxymethyltransferase
MEDITRLMLDAQVLEAAGAVAVVVEGVPREVAARITAAVEIPVIGIGAGPECDGQILVWHDLLRLGFGGTAKFVRSFGDAGATMREALELYREAVETRTFPSDAESYHLPGAVRAELERGLAVPQTV